LHITVITLQLPVEALRTRLVIAHEGEHIVAGTPLGIFTDTTLQKGISRGQTLAAGEGGLVGMRMGVSLLKAPQEAMCCPTSQSHIGSSMVRLYRLACEALQHTISQGNMAEPPVCQGIEYDGDHEEPAINLYSAIGHGLMHRVPLMAGRIRWGGGPGCTSAHLDGLVVGGGMNSLGCVSRPTSSLLPNLTMCHLGTPSIRIVKSLRLVSGCSITMNTAVPDKPHMCWISCSLPAQVH
jgi:hypothetical protein